jgi:hypothetical protein
VFFESEELIVGLVGTSLPEILVLTNGNFPAAITGGVSVSRNLVFVGISALSASWLN